MAAVGSADRIRGCGGRIVTTLMLRRDFRRAGRLHQASGVAGHQLLRPQEGGNRDERDSKGHATAEADHMGRAYSFREMGD